MTRPSSLLPLPLLCLVAATVPVHAAIAAAGRGQVFQAQSAADAAGVFRQQAAQTSTTVVVDAALPPGLTASTARLQLSLPWGGRTVEVAATTELTMGTGPVSSVAADPGNGRFSLLVGLTALFAALALVIFAAVAVPKSVRTRRQLEKLVAQYDIGGSWPAAPAGQQSQRGGLRSGALQLASRVAARRGIGDRLAARLEKAAVKWQPNEWLLLCVGIGVGAAALGALLGSLLVGLALDW